MEVEEEVGEVEEVEGDQSSEGKKWRRMIIDVIFQTNGNKNNDQIDSENEVIQRCVTIVQALVDLCRGPIGLPHGICWGDINLDHPKMPQLKNTNIVGAVFYLIQSLNKGGYTRYPSTRLQFGYQHINSPIPVLSNIHNQDATTHRVFTDLISKMLDEYGSNLFGQGRTYFDATCQEGIDHEKKSVPFYFSLFCQVMCLLRENEPQTACELMMGLTIESGIQALCKLDGNSAVHEPFKKSSLEGQIAEAHGSSIVPR